MNIEKFQIEGDIVGESDEDTKSLKHMAKSARNYISSFSWCPPIKQNYLAFGVGGIIAIFLMEFSKPIHSRDKYLWVINGDVPDAYLVLDCGTTPEEALIEYCNIMENWSKNVLADGNPEEVFPVTAPRTKENALDLLNRLRFIQKNVK